MSAKEYLQSIELKKSPRIKNTRKKVIDGIEFASTREARRYQDLAMMQSAKQIFELRRQVPFAIEIKGIHCCDWVADFVYLREGVRIVEDSKGHRTEVYKLKKKLVEAYYGFQILET